MILVSSVVLAALAGAAAPTVNPQTYVIGTDDILTIHVWKEPDLSRRVPVRPDGKISLPLINDVQAAGLTPARLASALETAFKKHMTEVDVAVMVEQVNSRKFYVLGEVARPGAYPLLGPTSVMQALTAAGGFREFANTKKIEVIRGDKRLRFDYKAVLQGKKPEQNFAIEPDDTIVVP